MKSAANLAFLKYWQERFSEHKRLLLAISGGKDSMTLLNWLLASQDDLGFTTLVLAHVNYGLRAEAEGETCRLREIAATHHLIIEVAYYQDPKPQIFTEARGRDFRYHFFEKMMAKYDCSALLTAHHRDDLAETLLMREIRGGRLFELQGLQERRAFGQGELIRPLLRFTKAELDAPEFFEDSSNQNLDYFRNRIRHQLLPALADENPRIVTALSGLADEIGYAREVIGEQIERLGILRPHIQLKTFLEQTEALQHFILQLYLMRYASDFQPRGRLFDEMLALIRRPSQYDGLVSKEYRFVKTATVFYLTKNLAVSLSADNLLDIRDTDPRDKSYLKINLPVSPQYSVRRRLPGDSLLVNGHTKTLKKFFIDNKVALADRNFPIIAVDGKVYAIPVIGVTSELSDQLECDTMKRRIWVRPNKERECSNNP